MAKLAYFKHEKASIFGCEIYIARGGYSGELGYEIYCQAKDAVNIWDDVLEAGKPFSAIAASWDSLDLTRIEAGLLFYPLEMPEGDTTPWEVNMAWGVDLNKRADYLGKDAVLALYGRERFKHMGILCDATVAVDDGAKLYIDDREVGVVTSACFSRYLMQSIAMVHIKTEFARLGASVRVQGSVACRATVVRTPFYDPHRLRTHIDHLNNQFLSP